LLTRLLEIDLEPHIAHGAAHNSDERCNAPTCHEETRKAIREDIISWIQHGEGDDEPKNIMWLSGPAGSGKTAIADSVAETCRRRGLLGATFFFSSLSGSVDRSSKRKLVATLAYHLSQHDSLPQFQAQLHAAIERHPDIFYKSLKVQAECLILEPFQNIRGMGAKVGWPRVIIIDGLDEVITIRHHSHAGPQILGTSEDDQVDILRVLLTLSQSPSFPLRIFVACRPERNIAEFLATSAGSTTTKLFLDTKYEPDVDIRRFFQAKFADIRRRAGISCPSWPGQSVLDRLVDMSSGQFIVPTTIIRWIEAGIPQLQLAEVLKMNQVNSGRKRNPFATLDALYRNILERAHNPKDDPRLAVKWILCATAVAGGRHFLFSSPCLEPSAMFWRQFLEDVEGEMTYRLAPIVSLISVPLKGDTRGQVSIYHKSLTDFLESPDRCGDLYVEDTAYNSFIADRIVSTLKRESRFRVHFLSP
jgi:SpoVK/Ycf46/Vps4 family AAA+-type ATPase